MYDQNRVSLDRKFWLLLIASWLLSIYFFIVFHLLAGFPPAIPYYSSTWIYLGLSVILALIPFITRITIGRFLDIQRQVERVDSKVDDFREEIRQSINVIASSVTAISNVSIPVNINLPGLEDSQRAQQKIRQIA